MTAEHGQAQPGDRDRLKELFEKNKKFNIKIIYDVYEQPRVEQFLNDRRRAGFIIPMYISNYTGEGTAPCGSKSDVGRDNTNVYILACV